MTTDKPSNGLTSIAGAHAAYQAARRLDASDRAERLAAIKKQVAEGSYRPNLELIAERMLPDLGRTPR